MSYKTGHYTKRIYRKVWLQEPALFQGFEVNQELSVDGVTSHLWATQDLPCHRATTHKADHEKNALPLLSYFPYGCKFCAHPRRKYGTKASLLHQPSPYRCGDPVLKGGKDHFHPPDIDKATLSLLPSTFHHGPIRSVPMLDPTKDHCLWKGHQVGNKASEFNIHYQSRRSIKVQALADFLVECTIPDRTETRPNLVEST